MRACILRFIAGALLHSDVWHFHLFAGDSTGWLLNISEWHESAMDHYEVSQGPRVGRVGE